ncbi:MAG: hypothetical protein MRY83_16350 [Flavobacteriales bacterium]|nr:hypothetical protein [Flavobacteriales bacterium]
MFRLSLVFSLCILCLTSHVSAYTENYQIGARSGGLAHATVAMGNQWSIFHNQAGLATMEDMTLGLSYESRFLLSELGIKAGTFIYPISKQSGVLGLSAYQFGFSQYSESKYGLTYAKSFGEKLRAGLQINYLQTRIGDIYGSRSMVSADFGVQADITDDLTFGASVFNINRTKLNDFNNERLPTILRFGFQYKFSDQLLVVAETEKDIDKTLQLKGGLEYHPTEIIYLRVGAGSQPFAYAFGFGLDWNGLQLDFSSSVTSVLGHSPQLALSYTFGKNK